jgi:hypothetical protein
MKKTTFTTMAAVLLAMGGVHCAADDAPTAPEEAGDEISGLIEEVAMPIVPRHCWAQIERPFPADLTLPIGTPITLRTGGPICPPGVNEKLAYRFYVEKVDKNGNIISPRVSPQGDRGWSLTKSPFDTSVLTPGRYRIYMFSLPRTMIPAWLADDPVARNTSRRSGNAYVEMVSTSWTAGEYGDCSASCGEGVRTRSVSCVDNKGATQPDSWCVVSKPDASEACTAGCEATTPNTIELGAEQYALTSSSGAAVDPSTVPPFEHYFYKAAGFWQDAETDHRVDVSVAFASKPVDPGDYAATGSVPTASGQAFITITRSIAGTTTYTSTAQSAPIKVRLGSDNQLHAIIDDPALHAGNETIPVKADIAIGGPLPP